MASERRPEPAPTITEDPDELVSVNVEMPRDLAWDIYNNTKDPESISDAVEELIRWAYPQYGWRVGERTG